MPRSFPMAICCSHLRLRPIAKCCWVVQLPESWIRTSTFVSHMSIKAPILLAVAAWMSELSIRFCKTRGFRALGDHILVCFGDPFDSLKKLAPDFVIRKDIIHFFPS